jgi:hypothetical protein
MTKIRLSPKKSYAVWSAAVMLVVEFMMRFGGSD